MAVPTSGPVLRVRSVLLTSGTLSPLSSFADELGLPFAHQLENPHVIRRAPFFVFDPIEPLISTSGAGADQATAPHGNYQIVEFWSVFHHFDGDSALTCDN